jgi:RND family efflux transporter MFP subunit
VNVGDRVQAGSVLIKVDDELKQANFEAADVNYQKAKRDLERFESLRKDNSVTDAQIEQARLGFKAAEAQYTVARRQLSDTKISSPISGIVTNRAPDIGTMIQPGMIVANVIDISRLKVKVSVSEKDVFRLKAGDSVQASTDIYPGVTFTGTIKSISSKGDESHTYPVEITLPNSSAHPLKAGMFLRVYFSSGTERTALTIPRDALVGTMKKPQVFIVENNLAVLRDVVIGTESADVVEVLSGLNGDELLVTSGKFNLKDSSKVSIAKNESEIN